MRNLTKGVASSFLDGRPWGGIKSKSQIRSVQIIAYTSRCSTRKPNSWNDYIYNFHVSELLNYNSGWPRGLPICVRPFGIPPGIIMTRRVRRHIDLDSHLLDKHWPNIIQILTKHVKFDKIHVKKIQGHHFLRKNKPAGCVGIPAVFFLRKWCPWIFDMYLVIFDINSQYVLKFCQN